MSDEEIEMVGRLRSFFRSIRAGRGTLQSSPTGIRDAVIKSFEGKLNCAVRWVWGIGFLYFLSNFVDYCFLCYFTWVLLRTSAPRLESPDNYFWFAVSMLLVAAARCASASFFMRLLVHPLAYQSQAPAEIRHSEDGHHDRSYNARLFSQVVQFIFAGSNLVFCFLIPRKLHKSHKENEDITIVSTLSYLALAKAVIGFLTLVVHALAIFCLSRKSPDQKSIIRYFDTVLERAISSGLVGAGDFEFFRFAYILLAGEFSRNVQPKAVATNHKDMNKYLYYHRLGLDFLLIFMDDKDAWVQLAAVNIVGFWADRSWGVGLESEVKLPKDFAKKLADKVGMAQVGWAATTCIGVLAASSPQWAKTLVKTNNSNGETLPDYMADIIDVNSKRSLSVVRTLVQLYEQLCKDVEQGPPQPDSITKLTEKVTTLAESAGVHRLRVQAAYLLILLKTESRHGPIKSIIEAIDPSKDSYWYQSEIEMLHLLYERFGLEKVPPKPKRSESDHGFNPPAWVRSPIPSQ